MARPPFRRARRSHKVPLDHVFRLMNLIQKHGKEEDFIKFAQDNNLTITAPPKAINAVKQHIYDEQINAKDVLAQAALDSEIDPTTGTPTCFPRKG